MNTITLQDLLTKIEREAEEKSLAAMRAADQIDRANNLSARLIAAGVSEDNAIPRHIYISPETGYVVTFHDYDHSGAMRRALAALNIEPIAERELSRDIDQPYGTRRVELEIDSGISIWLHYDPIPLAEAA